MSIAKPSEYYTLVPLKKYQASDSIDWTGPFDYMAVVQDKAEFFVKAKPEILMKLNASDYKIYLWGDSPIRIA